MSEYIVVFCTVPNLQTAEKIADLVVPGRLAACVNIVSGLVSVYTWKNELCRDQESLLIIKTRGALFNRLREAILSVHPYEVPEIISLPIRDGHPDYLQWITSSTIEPNQL